jgi:hypothetical protein
VIILGIKYFVFLLILSNIQYNLEKAGNDEEVENEEEDDDGFTATKKKDECEADPVGGKRQCLLKMLFIQFELKTLFPFICLNPRTFRELELDDLSFLFNFST